MGKCDCGGNLLHTTTFAETESGLFIWQLMICADCGKSRWEEVDRSEVQGE